ncbi:MAG: septum formation initiator family protein [Lachnospiraceae bacterium]|nr:septum formation initiator family protein [Lachnospiraceae bacterium]
MAKKKKANRFSFIVWFGCFVLIAGLIVFMVKTNADRLRMQEQEYIQKEEELARKIKEQEERTDNLNEEKKYVKTDKYIEEIAREKLGLINPDEILFKENEQ